MSCGLEHLSNCHGEITGLLYLLSAGSLWLRIKYDYIKSWFISSNCDKNQDLDLDKEEEILNE